jgi:hypothetical protein
MVNWLMMEYMYHSVYNHTNILLKLVLINDTQRVGKHENFFKENIIWRTCLNYFVKSVIHV